MTLVEALQKDMDRTLGLAQATKTSTTDQWFIDKLRDCRKRRLSAILKVARMMNEDEKP